MAISDLPPPRVLIVEDDRKLSTLLCRALAEDGLHAIAAFDGASALNHALLEPFDAVLLDVGLPRLGGLEVCARLNAAGVDTPVVMLSSRDSVEDSLAGRRAGAVDYIIKPFSMDEVSAVLHEVLRRHVRALTVTSSGLPTLALDGNHRRQPNQGAR